MNTKRVGNVSYDPNAVLGRGSFSFVYRGSLEPYHKNESLLNDGPLEVAVKRLLYSQQEANAIQREIELMQEVSDHPNILRYICTEKNDDFVFVVTELCRGTLENYVKGNYQGPRFADEKEILHQVTQGLVHLHSKGIVHRDIKPTNILIFVPVGCRTRPQVKLADFGLSKALNADSEDCTNTSVTNPNGTKGWMAPEVYELKRLDSKVDIFPLGCIFAYTLTGGKHPFGEDKNERILKIKRRELMIFVQNDLNEPYFSESVFESIKVMLEMVPENRPTAEEVLSNSFFSSAIGTNASPPIIFSKMQTMELIDVCNSLATRNDITLKWMFERPKREIFEISDQSMIESLHIFIKNGADLNCIDQHSGFSAFHYFCRYSWNDNLVDILQLFIRNGARINKKSITGSTPLHEIFQNQEKTQQSNLINLVTFLIENGADVNAKDDSMQTPLFIACKHQRENELLGDVIWLLIEAGADVKVEDEVGCTPLYKLCKHFKKDALLMDIVQLMTERGADIEAFNRRSRYTPLGLLANRGLFSPEFD